MEQQNNTQTEKLIFGLSPKATLINCIVITVLAQLLWAIVAVSQINPDAVDQTYAGVPWYYELPLNVLAIIMLLKWIDFKYKIEKFDFSFRAFRYRFIYGILLMSIFQMFMKIFFLITLLSLK